MLSLRQAFISAATALGLVTGSPLLVPSAAHAEDSGCRDGISIPGTTPTSCDAYPEGVIYSGTVTDKTKLPEAWASFANGQTLEIACGWKLDLAGTPVVNPIFQSVNVQGGEVVVQHFDIYDIVNKFVKSRDADHGFKTVTTLTEVISPEGRRAATCDTTARATSDGSAELRDSTCQSAPVFIKNPASTRRFMETAAGLCADYVYNLRVGGTLTTESHQDGTFLARLHSVRQSIAAVNAAKAPPPSPAPGR